MGQELYKLKTALFSSQYALHIPTVKVKSTISGYLTLFFFSLSIFQLLNITFVSLVSIGLCNCYAGNSAVTSQMNN